MLYLIHVGIHTLASLTFIVSVGMVLICFAEGITFSFMFMYVYFSCTFILGTSPNQDSENVAVEYSSNAASGFPIHASVLIVGVLLWTQSPN